MMQARSSSTPPAHHPRATPGPGAPARSSHPGCADLVVLARRLGFPWQEQGVFPGQHREMVALVSQAALPAPALMEEVYALLRLYPAR